MDNVRMIVITFKKYKMICNFIVQHMKDVDIEELNANEMY